MRSEQFRILFVDDDRVILATLAGGLRQAGFEVVTAECGEEALRHVAGQDFDLALLDLRMPGMSGLDLARAMREHRDIPVLILSAFGDEEVVVEAIAEGVLGYLVKPMDVAQLVPAMLAAIQRGRDLASLREDGERLGNTLDIERKTRTAVGILMERLRMTREAAFEALRGQARSRRMKIGEVAGELIQALETANGFARVAAAARERDAREDAGRAK